MYRPPPISFFKSGSLWQARHSLEVEGDSETAAKAFGTMVRKSQTRKMPPATFPQHALLVIKREMVSLPTFPNMVRNSSDREKTNSQTAHSPQPSRRVPGLYEGGTILILWHFIHLSISFVENATFPLWHVPHAFPSL